MGYILSEEGSELVSTVREFCENEVKEQCKSFDESGEFPAEIVRQGAEMGLSSLEVPEEYGGVGIDAVTCAAICEEMAYADAGFYTTMSASGLALRPVLIAGNEEQKKWACDILLNGGHAAFGLTEPMAGSDSSNTKTTAEKDGDSYILNGRKCFITNGGIADFYTIFAMTNKARGIRGISTFLVPRDTPGLSVGNHENKMGIRTSNTTDVVMEDVRVPASALLGKEGNGFLVSMKTLDMSRPYVGAGAVGIAQRCIDEAVAYSKQRVTFGSAISNHQAIQFMLADMEIRTETARSMVIQAVTRQEQGLSYSKESAVAKCYAGDIAVQNALDAIQILGGYGYSREYPVEKLLRDAKIFQIYEGTNQIQRSVIAKSVIKGR